MFRFENESFLYLFIVVGILIAIYVVFQIIDHKRLEKFCPPDLLEKLIPNRSKGMRHVKFAILMLALCCFILAAANPQTAGQLEKSKRKGVDVMFCLDVSNSMLARDIQPNRLDACKMSMSHFIDNLKGDRVGVVLFAGTAFVQLPATTDYAAAKMFISQISPDLIQTQGTNLSDALIVAEDALCPANSDETPAKEDAKVASKVIVLVSDGEDHFPESAQTAKELHEKGIIIHTIGIGSQEGATIPMPNGGVKKDNTGNTVITHLNEAALQDVAESAGGVYVHAKNTNAGFEAILNEIDKMEKSDIEDVSFSHFNSWFQYPLAIGLILILVEGFLFGTRPKWQDWLGGIRNRISRKPTMAWALCLLLLIGASCNRPKTRPSVIQEGNVEFRKGDSLRERNSLSEYAADEEDTTGFAAYEKALSMYDSAAFSESSNRNRARFNQLDAHYRLHNYDTISCLADSLLGMNADKQMAASTFYNKGNALMKKKQYGDAVEAFKEALRRNPNDQDAKYNLVYAQKMLDKHGNGGGGGGQGQNQQNQQQQQQQNGQGEGDQKEQQKQQNGQGEGDQQQQQQSQQGAGGGDKQSQEQQEQRAATLRQLDALQQNEKGTQRKVMRSAGDKLNKENNQKQKQDKDW